MTRVHPVAIEEVKHSTQKERRICDVLEPLMNQHRLVVAHDLIKRDYEKQPEPQFQLMYQLARITRDRGSLAQDDRLDVLAIAVGFWVEQMARDNELAQTDHMEALRDAELEKFMESIMGSSSDGLLWQNYN